MRIPQDPLTEEETTELRDLLEQSGGKDLEFSRGAFAALSTAPSEVAPPDWLPMLLGDQLPSTTQLKRMLGLLIREYNACADCLALGVPYVPSPDEPDAQQRFAKGYVQIAQRDEEWSKDSEAFELTAPLMLISGYAEAESLKSLVPALEKNSEAYREQHVAELGGDLVKLHAYFAEARNAKKNETKSAREKIGRNDPCPCKSGKKYKKCCAASKGE